IEIFVHIIMRAASRGGMGRKIETQALEPLNASESGQNITLTCQAPNNNIIVLEWSRADLGRQYVFLHRDGLFVPDDQHPSFKNRVNLQDRQMKDGDVSLILNNVTTADSGTYACRAVMGGIKRRKRLSVCVIRGEAASWLLMFVSGLSDVIRVKWILFRSSLITYLTADTSHLFLTCRSAWRRHRGWRREEWICWTDRWSLSFCCACCCCWWWFFDLQNTEPCFWVHTSLQLDLSLFNTFQLFPPDLSFLLLFQFLIVDTEHSELRQMTMY
uniref:Ig-like domain-containing protein n=1 Tax=Neolamprologus brichardi TaxID=32507 RepID=A0A3Q4M932_NEOBR